jgi:hypothetical protein
MTCPGPTKARYAPAMECICATGERGYVDCPVHVDCDETDCTALREPGDSVEELKKALEHWQEHGYLCGCSHGC